MTLCYANYSYLFFAGIHLNSLICCSFTLKLHSIVNLWCSFMRPLFLSSGPVTLLLWVFHIRFSFPPQCFTFSNFCLKLPNFCYNFVSRVSVSWFLWVSWMPTTFFLKILITELTDTIGALELHLLSLTLFNLCVALPHELWKVEVFIMFFCVWLIN